MTKAPFPDAPSQDSAISPTLEDVAKRAGVSTATVSRCLNNPAVVSEKTKERVLNAVKILGYTPNFGAQALAGKRTRTFGAIIPTMENAIFARGLQAFQEELQQHGITLLVASSSYNPDLEEEQIRSLVARGADALLLIGFDRTPQIYEFLKKQRIPCVVAWVYDPDDTQLSIGFDNRSAMRLLAEQVLDLGHRSIVFVTAELKGNDRARLRCEGVKQAMALRGVDPSTLHVIETPYSIGNGARALEAAMKMEPRPTAFMCGNDVLAAGALMQARKMGLDVPKDISITGFDDIEIAEIVTPTLTTVHVPHRNMGKGAARLLVALRKGEDPGPSVELEAKTMTRESLGPAP